MGVLQHTNPDDALSFLPTPTCNPFRHLDLSSLPNFTDPLFNPLSSPSAPLSLHHSSPLAQHHNFQSNLSHLHPGPPVSFENINTPIFHPNLTDIQPTTPLEALPIVPPKPFLYSPQVNFPTNTPNFAIFEQKKSPNQVISVPEKQPPKTQTSSTCSISEAEASSTSMPERLQSPSPSGRVALKRTPTKSSPQISSSQPSSSKNSPASSGSGIAIAPQPAIDKLAERRRRNRESSSRCYYNRKRIIDGLDSQITSEKRKLMLLYDRALELRHENARLKRDVVTNGIALPTKGLVAASNRLPDGSGQLGAYLSLLPTRPTDASSGEMGTNRMAANGRNGASNWNPLDGIGRRG